MKVFISWSGSTSRDVALLLTKWLQNVNPDIKPVLSDDYLRVGTTWVTDLRDAIQTCDAVILCLTDDNSPWMLFEAGHFYPRSDEFQIIPFLVGIEPSELKYPLAQFQAFTPDKESLIKLVLALSGRWNDLDLQKFRERVDANYPSFKIGLDAVITRSHSQEEKIQKETKRAARAFEESWKKIFHG